MTILPESARRAYSALFQIHHPLHNDLKNALTESAITSTLDRIWGIRQRMSLQEVLAAQIPEHENQAIRFIETVAALMRFQNISVVDTTLVGRETMATNIGKTPLAHGEEPWIHIRQPFEFTEDEQSLIDAIDDDEAPGENLGDHVDTGDRLEVVLEFHGFSPDSTLLTEILTILEIQAVICNGRWQYTEIDTADESARFMREFIDDYYADNDMKIVPQNDPISFANVSFRPLA